MSVRHPSQYADALLDHYWHPRNVGALPTDDRAVGTGLAGTVSEGGVVRLQLRIDASGIIKDTRFKAYGCGATIASASWLGEAARGKTPAEALQLGGQAVVDALDLPPGKLYCSFLVQEALEKAIADYTYKQE